MYDPVDAPRDPDRPIPPKREAEAERYGRPVDLQRVALTYWRARYWLIFAAAFGVAAGVAVAKLLVPHTYTASTIFVWEPDNGGQPRFDPDVRELRTLVDSIKIHANLAEIRRRRSMPKTLDQIASQLEVRFDLDSNLVELFAHEGTAEGAADLANTAVEVFLDREKALERTRREESVHSLEADVAAARTDLQSARAAYDAFRQENGISNLTVQQQQAIERVATLSAQAEIDRARQRAARAAASQRRPGVATPADPQANARLIEARAQLSQLRARYSDEHPQVQAAIAEVRQLEEAVRNAAASVVPTTPVRPTPPTPNTNVPDAPLQSEQQAASARQEVQALSAVEGRASELLADVRIREARVSDLEQTRARAQDAARSPSSGFRVVSPAWRPENPSRSYRKVSAIAIPVTIFLLVVLGIGINAVGRMRVYTAKEVAYWGRAPVIGTSTWPHEGQSVKVLVEELDDFAPRARGTTLIVGATSSEDSVATEIAERLQVYAVAVVDPREEAVVTPNYTSRPSGRPAPFSTPPRASNRPPPEGASGTDIIPVGERQDLVQGNRYQVAELSDLDPESVQREPHVIELWKGDLAGPQLRRQARLADRVVVVLTSGTMTFAELHALQTQIGRDTGVGFLLVGLPPYLSKLEDRVGPVDEFWRQRRA